MRPLSLRATLLTAASLCLLTISILPVSLQAQPRGLSYGIAPVGTRVFWDADAALSDGNLYGGALGLGFGQSLALEGSYFVGSGIETDFSQLAEDSTALDASLSALFERSVSVERYGGRLRFSPGSSRFTPHLSIGSGVLRLDPEGLPASRNLYALAGADLVLSGTRRYTFTVGGQVMATRYNPAVLLSRDDLANAGLERDALSTRTSYNPSVRAALSVYLGGRQHDQRTAVDQALDRAFSREARVFLTPFYGEADFDEALGFSDRQTLVGGHAGVRIGRYASLSGFYARGTEDGSLLDGELPSTFSRIQLYGGELSLRLRASLGGGLTPYLSVGGGYADVLSGYESENEDVLPEDRFFGLGGGGLEVPIFRALKLTGGVRAMLTSGSDLSNAEAPDDLNTSLFYSGGLSFSLGRNRRAAPRPPAGTPDALLPEVSSYQRDSTARSGSNDGQMMTIPVPENGELYVRFGNADSSAFRPNRTQAPAIANNESSPLETQALVRQTVRDAIADMEAGDQLSEGQVRAITREVLEGQIRGQDASRQRAELRELILLQRLERLEARLEGRPIDSDVNDELTEEAPVSSRPRLLGQPLIATWPHTGLRFGEGPTQIVLGLRGDYRAENGWFRLIPEASLGFGGGTSITAIANAAVPLPYTRRYTDPYAPYLGLGLGLVSNEGLIGLEPGLNLMIGAEYPFTHGVAFAEFSTFGLFDTTRLLTGYRLSL